MRQKFHQFGYQGDINVSGVTLTRIETVTLIKGGDINLDRRSGNWNMADIN